MEKNTQRLLVIAFAIAGLIGLGIILVQVPPGQVIKTFSRGNPLAIIIFLFASFMVMLTFSFRWMLILRAHGHKVPLFKLFSYRIAGYGISAMTPTAKIGGEPVRMMLLGKHKIPLSDRISSVLTDKIIEITTNFLFFLTGLVLVLIKFALPKKTEIFIIFLMALFTAIVVLYYYHIFTGRPFFSKVFRLLRLHKFQKTMLWEMKIRDMEKIMIEYHTNNKKNFYLVVIISSLGWAFTLIELHAALSIIGVTGANVGHLFAILSFIGLAYLIPIPLAIGSLEALEISIFAAMQFEGAPTAVALSLLVRSLDLTWIVVSVFIISAYGLQVRKIFQESFTRVDEEVTKVTVKKGTGEVVIKRTRMERKKPNTFQRIHMRIKERIAVARERKRKEKEEEERRRFKKKLMTFVHKR